MGENMQVCSNCGEKIKYIATGYNQIIVCDVEKIEIVTENGHCKQGYKKHICKVKEKQNGTDTN